MSEALYRCSIWYDMYGVIQVWYNDWLCCDTCRPMWHHTLS